jgi:hypothetical protein
MRKFRFIDSGTTSRKDARDLTLLEIAGMTDWEPEEFDVVASMRLNQQVDFDNSRISIIRTE